MNFINAQNAGLYAATHEPFQFFCEEADLDIDLLDMLEMQEDTGRVCLQTQEH